MEYLTSLIQTKILGKDWIPFHFSKMYNLPISHLLFVDDILIFSKANSSSIHAIKDVLTDFSNLSDLSLNLGKSKAWFSKTTKPQTINLFSNLIDIKTISDLGNYLCLHLKANYKISTLSFIN